MSCRLLLVFEELSPQHLLRRRRARSKARTDALQKQRLHEAGRLRPLLQCGRECFGRLIGEIEGMVRQQAEAAEPDSAVRVRGRIRVGMNIDADSLQQSGILQRLPATQDRVADNRVVLTKETRCEGLAEGLLLQKPERAEAAVGKEGLIGQPELQPQRREQRILARRRQRIAQPFPRVSFVSGISSPLTTGSALLPVRPTAEQFATEHDDRHRR